MRSPFGREMGWVAVMGGTNGNFLVVGVEILFQHISDWNNYIELINFENK